MSRFLFNSDSRLMLIAPHPDDESLACSVVLQKAVRADAAVRVIYVTDGQDNPWPQRVLERKWRLNAADRRRWGKLRRAEAIAALKALDLQSSSAEFLGLPDQKLTTLLMDDCESILKKLASIITAFGPTHLLVPSTADTHPDHSALAVMMRLILTEFLQSQSGMQVWSYVVHGRSPAFFESAHSISQSKTEKERKLLAIRCHRTQTKLSRRRFLRYAARPECFLKLSPSLESTVDGSIVAVSRESQLLRVELRLLLKPTATTEPTLFLFGRDFAGNRCCATIRIPMRSGNARMFYSGAGAPDGVSRYRGNNLGGEIEIPLGFFDESCRLFLKLERRSWFFDEAGWIEVPAFAASKQALAGRHDLLAGSLVAVR
jgi:LmbE family N-acetylglucosaminyl deacetylase